MSDVSVIGLGEMGSALAGALIDGGKTVTVWNRSRAKAPPLEGRGALVADTAHEAIQASPIVVICVSDYSATSSILDTAGVKSALENRLVVQLTSGIPRQARELAQRVSAAGALYLDGAIAAWPRQIGTPEAAILFSGPRAVFEEAESTLNLLGTPSYIGPETGSALVLFNAALTYLAGHWIGFSHGAAICEAEGLPVEAFGEMMAGLSGALGQDLRHMGQVIAGGRFGRPESTLRTASNDIARLVDLSDDLAIDPTWPAYVASVFQRGVQAGLGDEEHCAVTKLLRRR